MPLRSEVLTKRWSTANLPILPFLAPRVFQPWPSSGGRRRRTHTSAEASFPKTKIAVPDHDSRSGLDGVGEDVTLRSYVEVGERAARKSKDPSQNSTWDKGLSRYTRDTDTSPMGEIASVSVIWKRLGANPLEDIPHASLDICDQNRGTRPFETQDEASDYRLGGRIGVAPWKPAGVTTLDPAKMFVKAGYDGTNAQSLEGFIDNMQEEGMGQVVHQNKNLPSWNSLISRGKALVDKASIRVTSPAFRGIHERPELHEKDIHFYWLKMFKDLESLPKYEVGDIIRQSHNSEQISTHPRFANGKEDSFWFRHSVISIWEDLIRLNNTEFETVWNGLSPRTQIQSWPGLMLMALRNRPSEALKLLEITYTSEQPPAFAISDSLDYLISHYLFKPRGTIAAQTDNVKYNDTHSISHNLQKTFTQWLSLQNGVRITQRSVWILASRLRDEQLRAFYEDLTRLKYYLFPHTMIHFADRFAKSEDAESYELSFTILNELSGRLTFDHPAVMSLCTVILHRSHQAPDAGLPVTEKFQIMVKHGLKVNIIIYNVLIHNAIRSGDSENAWNIHELMLETEVEPDEFTYSILLNDAKWRMDSVAIRSVMGHLQEKNIAGPYIVTDLIHLIFLLHHNAERASREVESESIKRSRRKIGFEKMLGKYCEHFHVYPLGNLVPNFSRNFPQAINPESHPLIDPPTPTLVVMLTGLLYSLDSATTKALYDRFIKLIGFKDPLALKLASDTHIWNVFLMAHGRFHDLLTDCPKIVRTMITLRDEAKAELQPKQGAPFTQQGDPLAQQEIIAEPNVYTWSVLLNVFTKHKHFLAAEKVLTAMQSRGTPPSEVTWTTLAFGYSRAQNVEKLADTIHRMEKSGIEVSANAVAAMAKIQDREGLIRALKLRKASDVNED